MSLKGPYTEEEKKIIEEDGLYYEMGESKYEKKKRFILIYI